MKNSFKDVTISFLQLLCFLFVFTLVCILAPGCNGALERGETAARSNRATYGAISIVVSGDNSQASITMGDGLLASADGEGAVTQTPSQGARQRAEMETSGTDPISAGIMVAGRVAGKWIDAKSGKDGADSCADCTGGVSCASCGDAASGCSTCSD